MKRIKQNAGRLSKVALIFVGLLILFTNCSEGEFVPRDPATAASDGSDPLYPYAWHLNNTGQSVFAKKAGTAGADLNMRVTESQGLTGKDILVLVSDDGVEDVHEDLSQNYKYGGVSKDYTKSYPYLANNSAPKGSTDTHGTAVAGLIAATRGNGTGARGVASGAKIVSANFLSEKVVQTSVTFLDQASGSYDIFNMSWGTTQNSIASPDNSFVNQLAYGVHWNRNHKGSLFVKAAGNDFFVKCQGASEDDDSINSLCIGNSNFDPDNSNPYMILTAALDAKGFATTYSSPGSNLWVSAPGGEFGDDSPAMVTTDRMGCNVGISSKTSKSVLAFEKGSAQNPNCNYSVAFNGTSSAAPVLSGVVALLLEANPQLTWRDVKYILAKTAVPVDYTLVGSIAHPLNAVLPSGAVWEQAWILNSAGFKFHNWYGFGKVNVDAAVALAKSYNYVFGTYTETNWTANRSGLTFNIPDNSSTGISDTLIVSDNIKIEAVQLKLWITHPDISELAVELTSPSGAKSILINMRNSLTGMPNFEGEIFLTNAFYQESSAGTWKIKIIDGRSGKTGMLTRWSLNFAGGL